MIVLGAIVTWGSGDPEGRVDLLHVDDLQKEAYADVVLTKDIRSPCGRTWAKGTSVRLPVKELRLLS